MVVYAIDEGKPEVRAQATEDSVHPVRRRKSTAEERIQTQRQPRVREKTMYGAVMVPFYSACLVVPAARYMPFEVALCR